MKAKDFLNMFCYEVQFIWLLNDIADCEKFHFVNPFLYN